MMQQRVYPMPPDEPNDKSNDSRRKDWRSGYAAWSRGLGNNAVLERQRLH
jgi:hypothetical protein